MIAYEGDGPAEARALARAARQAQTALAELSQEQIDGIVTAMSTDTGRGWVSNNSGKPTTASNTSTAAPIRR